MKKKKKNYANNEDLLIELEKMKQNNKMTEELGKMIMEIAKGYSIRFCRNFHDRTHVQDMISDAVLTVVKYIHNFNTEKSKNPFAYITQITHFAFINFCKKENKLIQIKKDLYEDHVLDTMKFDKMIDKELNKME